MARGGGFLSRIAKGLGNAVKGLGDFFGVGGEPEKPVLPPVPPPAPPPEPPRPPAITRENGIWQDVAKGRDRDDSDLMAQWFELYRNAVDPLILDDDEFYGFWRDFLKAFYLVSGERGSIKRDTFYRRIGVRKRDFQMDWQEWRELKRGTP
jgi:hypothetical protein